jgi:hypothetical protein
MTNISTQYKVLQEQNRVREAGVTLMEMIAALSVIAVITIGSLALYNAATSSQASTQLVQDVTAVRAAVKGLWLGQGSYGVVAGTNLDATLISSRRLPTTLRNNAGTLFHVLNGTISVTGFPAEFDIDLTNISPDVCLTLLTNTSGWTSVQVDAAAAITTFPITPATAVGAGACGVGGGANVAIEFTSQ